MPPIEHSHGRARPTLPRASDLQPVDDAVRERGGSRDAAGRFVSGNAIGRGRGWKRAIAKMLGRQCDDPVAQAVADDAWRLFSATLRELPNDGPTVRGLAASRARHAALESFWSAQAIAAGLATQAGIAAQDIATKHGQRAERLAVTMLDVSVRLKNTRPPVAPFWAQPDEANGPDQPDETDEPPAAVRVGDDEEQP